MSAYPTFSDSTEPLPLEDTLHSLMALGDEPGNDPQEAKTILILKIAFIFAIFGIALLFGILPAKIKSCGRNPRFMSMANAFSGGLFLAIALVHILPDVVHDYDDYIESQHNHTTVTSFLMDFKGK